MYKYFERIFYYFGWCLKFLDLDEFVVEFSFVGEFLGLVGWDNIVVIVDFVVGVDGFYLKIRVELERNIFSFKIIFKVVFVGCYIK